MRTTIRLDGQLQADIKDWAILSGKTLTAVIEEFLRESLSRRQRATGRPELHPTTVGGNGLFPGVDLDDPAALLDVMDQPDAPH